jgi:hypothetical protein
MTTYLSGVCSSILNQSERTFYILFHSRFFVDLFMEGFSNMEATFDAKTDDQDGLRKRQVSSHFPLISLSFGLLL